MKFNTVQNVCCRVLLCVRNEKWTYEGQWQKDSDIVLLFYIVMHDPTIWFERNVVRLTYIDINMGIVYI